VLFDDSGKLVQETSTVPELTEQQQQEAEARTSVTALIVHEAIRKDGEEELQRPVSALAWSGLAAGLSDGFLLFRSGAISLVSSRHDLAAFGGQPWLSTRISDCHRGTPTIVHGEHSHGDHSPACHQEPFHPSISAPIVDRSADREFGGAHAFAWVIGHTPLLKADFQDALTQLALNAADVSFGVAVLRGIFAGWLIAMVVWMLAATDSSRVAIIFILTHIVGLAGLTHIVAGSVEVLFLVMTGARSWFSYAWGYMLPSLIGNVIGGVALVSALNHAQVMAGRRTPVSQNSRTGGNVRGLPSGR
jgi:formate/nitrite transporter FocA (FNT family)